MGVSPMHKSGAFFRYTAGALDCTGGTPVPRLWGIVAAICIVIMATTVSAMNVSALRPVPVLDNGRVKPIDTVARDTVRFVTGQEKYDGREALDIAMDWAMNPQVWQKRKLLYVPLIELRKKLGMAESEKLIEPDRVRTNGEYRTWVAELDRRRDAADRTGEVAPFSRLEDAGMELERRLGTFDSACDAVVLRDAERGVERVGAAVSGDGADYAGEDCVGEVDERVAGE